jgi:hypothetical protein
MNKKWSEEQVEKLTKYQGEGLPEIDGKSENAIYRKMRSLGLQIKCKQPHWTEEELDILRSCDGSHVPVIKGRTSRAVRYKMNKMGIHDPSRPSPWLEEEIEILRQHSLNKKTGVPKIQGRTKDAVLKKIKDLNLDFFRSKVCGKHTVWSDEEIAKVYLIAQGMDITITNRSKNSIRRKIKELNLKKNRIYEQWTEEEIKLVKQNKPVPGRSKKSINRKRIDLGLLKRKPRRSWTLQNEKKLKKLVREGHSALQILEMGVLPKKFTIDSIQKKMCRLNLAKKMAPYKRFSEHTQLLFESFLKENWQNKLPQELADQWNELHPKEKIGHRRVIRYLSKLDIKVSSYEMASIRRQKEKEKKIIESAGDFSSVKKFNERIRADRVELMRKRFERKKNIWTGKDMEGYELEAFKNFGSFKKKKLKEKISPDFSSQLESGINNGVLDTCYTESF